MVLGKESSELSGGEGARVAVGMECGAGAGARGWGSL